MDSLGRAYSRWRLYLSLLLVSLFLSSLSSLYTPLLPQYVEDLGGAPFIATASTLAIPQLTAAPLMLFASLYADRYGKRVEVFLATLAIGVWAHIILVNRSLATLIASRSIAGIAMFVSMPVATSIISSLTPRKTLGRVIALYSGLTVLAGAIPQILSGVLYSFFNSYNPLFYIATAFSVSAFLIALPVCIEIRRHVNTMNRGLRVPSLTKILRLRTLVLLTVGHAIYSIGWNILVPPVPFIMDNIFNVQPNLYTAVFGIAMLMLGAGQFLWGPAIDRCGGRKVIISAFSASVLIAFSMSIAVYSLWLYSALLILFTVFSSAGPPSVSYIASRSVDPDETSIAVSIPWVFAYIASAGGFVAGALISSVGLRATLIIASVIQLIGLAVLYRVPKGL